MFALACGVYTAASDNEVLAILGQPDGYGERNFMGATGEYSQRWEYDSGDLVLLMTSSDQSGAQTVSQIRLSGSTQRRTSYGIGIGGSENDVYSAYGSVVNDDHSSPGTFIVVGSIFDGIGFRISSGTISSITIGPMAE